MRIILRFFLLIQITLVSSFILIKTLGAEEVQDFNEYFQSFKNKTFNFDVYFEDDYVFDEIIRDSDKSKRSYFINAEKADGKNDVMALLKLECDKKVCNVTGNFSFDFKLVGLKKI